MSEACWIDHEYVRTIPTRTLLTSQHRFVIVAWGKMSKSKATEHDTIKVGGLMMRKGEDLSAHERSHEICVIVKAISRAEYLSVDDVRRLAKFFTDAAKAMASTK